MILSLFNLNNVDEYLKMSLEIGFNHSKFTYKLAVIYKKYMEGNAISQADIKVIEKYIIPF